MATPPAAALRKPAPLDLRDTNAALLGSGLDHRVKHASAASEPAWNDGRVGRVAGLWVWRVEDFCVVAVPPAQAGVFFEGDSYVVLSSSAVGPVGPVGPVGGGGGGAGAGGAGGAGGSHSHAEVALVDPAKLSHSIFFFLGRDTSQDEAGVAAYKTVELDEFLQGRAAQHREAQGALSPAFAALFPRLVLRRGGVASGFRHVEAGAAERADRVAGPRMLLRVFRPAPSDGAGRAEVVVHEVEPSWRSLDDRDVFVLDAGDRVWVWQGSRAGPMEKARAAQVAGDLAKAKALNTEVVAQGEGRARRVVELLAGSGEEVPSAGFKSARPQVLARGHVQREDEQEGEGVKKKKKKLFRLSDASGQPSFELVKEGSDISAQDLDGADVFLLDNAGRDVWVWEGQGASRAERALWLRVTQAYLAQLQQDDEDAHLTPVAKVCQGHESVAFRQAIAAN
jgi:gelsolin